jgi:hypothetical protein
MRLIASTVTTAVASVTAIKTHFEAAFGFATNRTSRKTKLRPPGGVPRKEYGKRNDEDGNDREAF